MSLSNLNQVHLTDEQITAINEALTSLENALKPLKVNLTTDDRNPENQLASIHIPNSVVKVGDGAFRENKLTSMKWSESISEIGAGVFMDNQFSNINLPNHITHIKKSAFRDNPLEAINIPSNVVFIGYRAFADYNLRNKPMKTITVEADTPPNLEFFKAHYGYGGYDIFSQIQTIYVPAQSVNAYKQAVGWRGYAQYIKPKN